jgi:hypothetical protein
MLDSGCQLPIAEPAAGAVRLRRSSRPRFALAALFLALATSAVFAGEALVSPDELARTIVIQNLSVQGSRVAGVIANLSDRPIRDVRLQIVFSWLWADEHRQGTNDPSFVATELIRDEIPPRGQVTFGYSYPAADTVRGDGRFIVEAKIVGYRVLESRTITP